MNPGRTKWWQRPWRIIPVALLFLAALGAVGYLAASKTGLKRELAAIRAKGLPTNPKELDAWYAKVPAEENAALKFLEAREHFVEVAESNDPSSIDWRAISLDERLSPETVHILKEHSSKNLETLRLMRAASKLKRSRYPTDLSRAPDLDFKHLAPIKGLAQLARWEAVLQAEEGNAEAALEALKCGFALGTSLAQEPLLISELVRIACVAIQLVGTERVINVVEFNDRQLAELEGAIREAMEDCRNSFERAMIGERAFANTGRKYTFAEYEQMISMGGLVPTTSETPEIFRKLFYYARRGVGMHDRDHAFYMRSLGRIIDLSALNHPEYFQSSESLIADISRELQEHPIALEMSAFSLPSMLYVPKKEVLLVARLRCSGAALQIEQWRRKNKGKLPSDEDLISVLQAYTADPVDGAPLKYQTFQTKGYKVIARAATARNRADYPNARDPEIDFEVLK